MKFHHCCIAEVFRDGEFGDVGGFRYDGVSTVPIDFYASEIRRSVLRVVAKESLGKLPFFFEFRCWNSGGSVLSAQCSRGMLDEANKKGLVVHALTVVENVGAHLWDDCDVPITSFFNISIQLHVGFSNEARLFSEITETIKEEVGCILGVLYGCFEDSFVISQTTMHMSRCWP